MSSIPNQLDPPKGDYVTYIEKLQQGKIRVPEGIAPPKEAGESRRALEIGTPEPKARPTSRRNPMLVRAFGPFVVFLGIASIAGAIIIEKDAFIPIGMFMIFVGMIIATNTRK